MSIKLDSEFGPVYVPGAYVSTKVQTNVRGLSTTGVVAIIGEAEGGMPGSSDDIENNFFGADQLADIQSKYISGNIVDAYRALVAASSDQGIQGAVQRVYVYKTNASTKAQSILSNAGFGAYGTLSDSNFGQKGNLLNYLITAAQAEISPRTGSFSFVPAGASSSLKYRVNGGAAQTVAISAKMAPATFANNISLNNSDLYASGGIDRAILAGLSGQNITVTASGANATFTLDPGQVFASLPVVGDVLVVPASGDYSAATDSVVQGAGNANRGAYIVTGLSNSVSSAFITAKKINNDTNTVLTNPVAVTSVAISAGIRDIVVYSSMELIEASGDNRAVLTGLVGQLATVSASGANLTFTLASAQIFASFPQVNDIVRIASGSAYAGAGNANVGYYKVTVVSNTVSSAFITASRLDNGAPVAVASTAIVAVSDLVVSRPYKAGIAKVLEVFDGAGTLNIDKNLKQFDSAIVEWVSTSSDPVIMESDAEYIAQVNVNRSFDNINQSFTAGGDIALEIGYLGTTCSVVINATTLSTTVVGGTGSNLSITLANFATLADLAGFINSQTGYVAKVGNTLLGTLSPSKLDQGIFGAASSISSSLYPARIKRDLSKFVDQANALTAIDFVATAVKGLPDVSPIAYLSGGAKGGTTSASILAALSQIEGVTINFVVPLFSRDAAADIADGLTESSSTYTIDAINQAVKDHVIALSTFKRKKHRQGFLSFKGSFLDAKNKSLDMANFRLAMAFQDFKGLSADGTIKQYPGWRGACLAAGMQAAAFYKSLVKKFINASGVTQAAGDFRDNNISQVEDALQSGLLIAEKVNTGGIRWISDQTTYGTDANFVYNSIQAVYASDTIALSLAERVERAFVGQSLSDVSIAAVEGFINAVMFEYLRLKLITGDDEAPMGFKDLRVKIEGPVMYLSLAIKLNTSLYFVPITLTIEEVRRSN